MIVDLWHKFSGIRFIAIGILNTVIDFGIFNILIFVFNLNSVVANTISVSIAMTISFFLNRSIVFRHEGKNNASRFIKFIAITAFGLYFIQNLIVFVFSHKFTLPAEIATDIIHAIGLNMFSEDFIIANFAKALATGVTMVWNYFMYKKFVFGKDDNEKF
jgi:putative flippase GtrA